jgi:hypothetical protein
MPEAAKLTKLHRPLLYMRAGMVTSPEHLEQLKAEAEEMRRQQVGGGGRARAYAHAARYELRVAEEG